MSHYYVACELGAENGRVVLGTLHEDELIMSEVRHFQNRPIQEKDSLLWNIHYLYEEILTGLRSAAAYEEPVDSVSCTSWAGDYLLFNADGSLITPTYYPVDSRTRKGMEKVFTHLPWEAVYQETGRQQIPASSLCQLGVESGRRLKRANHLLPVADGFNFLLAGVPRVEKSLASTTQLYNPITDAWSEQLVETVGLPRKLLPPLVPAGTALGLVRPEIANGTKMTETQVIASCSHEVAAALAGLPVSYGESWACLWPGTWTMMGTQVPEPIINDATREMNFTNEIGYGGAAYFYKRVVGLWILEQCQQYWEERDRGLDIDMLGHLAGSAPPFESLIDPTDPRFLEPDDMPLKVQAFCKDTNQPVPRKPGPIWRCALESLALLYRKTLQEIEYLTDSRITRLYVLGGGANTLLTHFTANALQLPVVVASPNATAIGNVLVQALALGHLKSLEEARDIVRRSSKLDQMVPHPTAWNAAYDRFVTLKAA